MEDKLLYRINVSGRVQGVGFRWNAAYEARNRGIKGYVKNMSDGTVYIEAEGSPNQLNTFLEWCKKGPAHSSVASVIVNKFPPVDYTEFRIES
jgi:acylphosphatase